MSDFRVRYGLALGPEGTYAQTSGQSLLGYGDTTPDVSTGVLFYTNNTSATSISHFDVLGAGGINGVSTHQGKRITVFFRDANTTLTGGGQLNILGGGGVMPAGTVSEFLYHNSAWYETGRNTPSSSGVVSTVTVAGSAAPSVSGVEVLLVNNTAACTIMGLSGGQTGQRVIVLQAVAAVGTALNAVVGVDLWFSGTAAFVLNGTTGYHFVCDAAPRFRQVGPATIP